MPSPARRAAPPHGRRRPDLSPLLAAGALPAAGLSLLALGAGSAGASPSRPGASTPGQDRAPRADRIVSTGAISVLAGLQSAASFERTLGFGDRGPVTSPRRARAAHRAPDRASRAIAAMTAAGDRIARLPYVYGGGHGSFTASGYDCSGSVSYLLHAAGLLSVPADSSGLESFGQPGPGRRVTIYANAQHALMTIDGRRYDTIAFQETGTRWSASLGSTDGYVERHPAGM